MKLIRETITGTAASGAFRIAALDHEIGNYPMEDGAVVKRLPGLRSIGERDEIVHRVWRLVGVQFDLELSFRGVEGRENFICHRSDCSKWDARLWLTICAPDRVPEGSSQTTLNIVTWRTMRPENIVPLTLEEHRDLSNEMKTCTVRLRELCGLVVGIYGAQSLAGFSFLKAMDAVEHLNRELQNQARQDLKGRSIDGMYV